MKKLVSTMFYDSLVAIIFAAIAGTIGMVVDGVLIGRCLGEDAMAAFGIASPVFLVLYALGAIFSSGMQAKCAEMIGAGKIKESNDFFSLSITLSIILSAILMTVLLLLETPIARILGAAKDASYLLNDTSNYMLGLSFGIPVILLSQCMQNSMQLDGDKTRIFASTIVMTISDIIADLMNVYVLHGGMFGMAAATSISYYLGFVVYLFHFKKDNIIFHYSLKNTAWGLSGELIKTGLPTAIGRFSTTVRTFILNNILLAVSGTAAVAALSTQTNINNFFSSVGVGISMTVLMLAGIYYGEENRAEMKALLVTSIKADFIIISALGVIIFAAAPFFASMYISKDSASFYLCISSIRFLAISLPLHVFNNIFMNYLQGSKNLRLSHITCLLNELILVVLFAFIFGKIFGATGVWLAFPVGKLMTMVFIGIMAAFYEHRPIKSIDDFLFLPEDFDKNSEDGGVLDIDIAEDFTDASEAVNDFLIKTEARTEQIDHVRLILDTIMSHFRNCNGQKAPVANLRIIKGDTSFTIRYRDDIKKMPSSEWNEFEELTKITKTLQRNSIMGTNGLYIELQ